MQQNAARAKSYENMLEFNLLQSICWQKQEQVEHVRKLGFANLAKNLIHLEVHVTKVRLDHLTKNES